MHDFETAHSQQPFSQLTANLLGLISRTAGLIPIQAGAIKRQLNRGVGVYRCLSPHSTAMTEAEGTPDGYDRVAVD